MNAMKTTIGLVSVVALTGLLLPMMKGHDAGTNHPASVVAQVQPLTSPETPQSQQWDMEFGDRTKSP